MIFKRFILFVFCSFALSLYASEVRVQLVESLDSLQSYNPELRGLPEGSQVAVSGMVRLVGSSGSQQLIISTGNGIDLTLVLSKDLQKALFMHQYRYATLYGRIYTRYITRRADKKKIERFYLEVEKLTLLRVRARTDL